MKLPSSEVLYKKVVGHLGKRRVWAVGGIGGCHVVGADGAGSELEMLGLGSHPGLARHIAQMKAPGIVYDALEKSSRLDLSCFADVLPYWEEQTAAARRMQGHE